MRWKAFSTAIALMMLPLLAHAQVDWVMETITSNYPYAWKFTIGDMDNDGDGDLVVTNNGGNDNHPLQIYWNDGGDFTLADIGYDQRHYGLELMDLNADDQLDIIYYTNGGIGEPDTVFWYDNNGGAFTRHMIDDAHEFNDNLGNVFLAHDYDLDGDVDVAVREDADNFVIYDQTPDGFEVQEWFENVFHEGSMVLVDLEADGDMDIATPSFGSNVERFWNQVGTWGESDLEFGIDAEDICVGDRDADGDDDIFSARSGNIRWMRNDDGLIVDHYELPYDPDGNGTGFTRFTSEDVDGDGDDDLIGVLAGFGNDVRWVEHVQPMGELWVNHLIFEGNSIVNGYSLGDVDGDGDLDLAIINENGAELLLFYNNGADYPDLIEVTLVPTSPTDLPAEGGTLAFDVDVVSNLPGTYPGVMFWTKVLLPNGAFYPQVLFQTSFTLPPYFQGGGSLTQDIPAFAPQGGYELWGWVGQSPNGGPSFGNYFAFTKAGAVIEAAGQGCSRPAEGWSSRLVVAPVRHVER